MIIFHSLNSSSAKNLNFRKNRCPWSRKNSPPNLSVSGADSWSKLQQAITSSSSIDFRGEKKTLTELRAMAYDKDERTRAEAWEKEVELCRSMEIPGAFALNGVKGFCNTVNSKRGWESTLEKSAAQARISRSTLDALIETMTESLPVFRKIHEAEGRAPRKGETPVLRSLCAGRCLRQKMELRRSGRLYRKTVLIVQRRTRIFRTEGLR